MAISLLAGLYANDILDNARIFGLLPFFVLGLKMHEGHWNLLRARRARWYGIAVLVAPVRARAVLRHWFETEWLYYRTRYDALDPRQPARDRDPDVAADHRAWSARSRSSPSSPRTQDVVHRAGRRHARRLPVPRLRGAGRGVRRLHRLGGRPHAALAACSSRCSAIGLALFLAWQPVSSRLNVLVDPVGTFTRRRRRRRGASSRAPSVGITALNGTTSSTRR